MAAGKVRSQGAIATVKHYAENNQESAEVGRGLHRLGRQPACRALPGLRGLAVSRHDDELRLADWFCGAGGSRQAIATIAGVRPVQAANHWDRAIESHAANFPTVGHHLGDIRALDVAKLPYAELFWASPEYPAGSQANGKEQGYATFDEALPGLEPYQALI